MEVIVFDDNRIVNLQEKWKRIQLYKEVLDSTIRDVYEELQTSKEKKHKADVQNRKNHLIQKFKEK